MNDPRITAYALNELQGAERETFEADLATNPHLQRDLLSACELTDALGEVTEEPREGLDPQARAFLLREAIANQQAFRVRRKIIRFAVPASLAAAASIALLLLVSGGITTQKPAVAAARGPEMSGQGKIPGERIFIRSDSAAVASGAVASDPNSNAPVPQKRVMTWDAKVLGADVGPSAPPGR